MMVINREEDVDARHASEGHSPLPEEADFQGRLTWAREVLGLGETVTRIALKDRVRELLHRWHPDHARTDRPLHERQTRFILMARDIIGDYCDHYRISFASEEIDKYLPPDEWFKKRFGDHS
ncbi:MAG: hypothetical protein HQL76_02235 [Magnetococcales bacterium]|nr:hypothetical protein [Magnetococcales bacterium]